VKLQRDDCLILRISIILAMVLPWWAIVLLPSLPVPLLRSVYILFR
jgi:hypothetical protein